MYRSHITELFTPVSPEVMEMSAVMKLQTCVFKFCVHFNLTGFYVDGKEKQSQMWLMSKKYTMHEPIKNWKGL